MKLPFEFATKLVFRLILPGLILATAFAPGVQSLLQWNKINAGLIEILSFGVVFWGWLIIICDMPIYMLYEGRRFWPELLRKWGESRERKRLMKLNRNTSPEIREGNYRLYMESWVEKLQFPLSEGGEPEVQYPTRLGNLMTAYETYPSKKYGIDAIFYWYRLWVVLDKDTREEMDNNQALADSPVYVSFCLAVSAIAFAGYAVVSWAAGVSVPYISAYSTSLAFAAGCGMAAYAFYRISIFAHGQYGELFKSLFDQYRSKLTFEDLVEQLAKLQGMADLRELSEAEKYRMVAAYLRYHLIRPPSERRSFTPEEWKGKKAERDGHSTSRLKDASEREVRVS